MKKHLKKKVGAVIAKGDRMLRRKPKAEKSFDESGEPIVSRQFLKMKKKEERMYNLKKDKEVKVPKTLRIWDRNFGGSLHHITKKTAEFLKKANKDKIK